MRPGKNDPDRNFLCRDVRDRDVFREMPVIGDVRLNRQTFAEVFRSWLQKTEILPAATHDDQNCEDREAGLGKVS